MSLARRQIPSRLSLNTPSTPNFRDSRSNTPEREIIRALSPTTERELRRSCSVVVLGLASPRVSTIPEQALPTPAFPKQQTLQGRTQSQSQAQIQPPVPQTQPWSQFDFKLSSEGSTSSHSISSSIDSTFSRTSSEMGTSSWSPTTTHQSKSSDGDQFFHAQTADLTVLPPMPQKPMPGSPPPRYAFAKTATARKMSLNYQQINPRASSIVTVAAEQRGETPPVLVRPTMIHVPRPRTSSGIPGSPRFRNSNVPPSLDGSTKSRCDSQGNVSVSGLGLGLSLEVQTAKANAVAGSPLATPTKLDNTLELGRQSPAIVRFPSPAPLRHDSHHIRSATSTPLLNNPRSSTPNPPKELTRRRTDMDPPTNPRKFSLFPCQDLTPVIIKDTPPVVSSPPARSVTSRQMSISSIGRPRTSGGAENSKPGTESWNRPLPALPAVSDVAGKPGKSKKGGKEKGEKTTFKGLRKQVLASFQNFSGSLKLKSSSSSKEKSGSRKGTGTHGDMPHVGIGVAA